MLGGQGRNYLLLESGGQSERTSIGLPPLCTVGAAESAPPASGKIALFSTAMELDVFSTPLPEFAAGDVVQLVSVFTFGAAGGSANAIQSRYPERRVRAIDENGRLIDLV